MDNLFRLFCGCCTSDSNDPSTPYRPLGDNDVMTVRDPPITNPNFYLNGNGHENGGLESIDGRSRSAMASPTPAEQHKNDQETEKDMLASILETTQHNIIAVGQMDHTGLGGREIFAREKKYETLIKDHEALVSKGSDDPSSSAAHHDYAIDFELDVTQKPKELPLIYEEISTLIVNAVESQPFSCPQKQGLLKARHLGLQNPTVMMEHPDVKKAGRLPPVSKVLRQKLRESADEVHSGVDSCHIVHKTQLVVFMDL